ncbi:MAG: hypothetical protein LBR47_02470 [Spirochaetaceae bacterium]|jgi:hypothetical protein|nr:hypothetical protein [Spirochaetaceae bacterium]
MEKENTDYICALCKLSAISDLLSHYAPEETIRTAETCEGIAWIIDDIVVQLSVTYENLTKNGLSDVS